MVSLMLRIHQWTKQKIPAFMELKFWCEKTDNKQWVSQAGSMLCGDECCGKNKGRWEEGERECLGVSLKRLVIYSLWVDNTFTSLKSQNNMKTSNDRSLTLLSLPTPFSHFVYVTIFNSFLYILPVFLDVDPIKYEFWVLFLPLLHKRQCTLTYTCFFHLIYPGHLSLLISKEHSVF